MNEFDRGFMLGKFFASFVVNEDFFGLAIRIGKEFAVDAMTDVYHITIQIGYGQITVGIAGGENG